MIDYEDVYNKAVALIEFKKNIAYHFTEKMTRKLIIDGNSSILIDAGKLIKNFKDRKNLEKIVMFYDEAWSCRKTDSKRRSIWDDCVENQLLPKTSKLSAIDSSNTVSVVCWPDPRES